MSLYAKPGGQMGEELQTSGVVFKGKRGHGSRRTGTVPGKKPLAELG